MTTTYPPVVRIVSPSDVHDVLRRYGMGNTMGLGDILADRIAVPDVRAFAVKLRNAQDAELPDRPRVAADALNALCDEAEARPADGWDIANLSEEHRTLVYVWADRLAERSPLLKDAAEHLRGLSDMSAVTFARQVLEVLTDIDALLPGVDAELRPVLALYAGESS